MQTPVFDSAASWVCQRQNFTMQPSVSEGEIAVALSALHSLAAKCRAVLEGRHAVSPADIRAVALPVLRHRIITNFNAEADGIKPDDLVRRLIESIPVDESESADRGTVSAVLRPSHAGANSRP